MLSSGYLLRPAILFIWLSSSFGRLPQLAVFLSGCLFYQAVFSSGCPFGDGKRAGIAPRKCDVQSKAFEQLIQYVLQKPDYQGEIVEAKAEFETLAGKIYDTDRGYDARIKSFHNWYILDRKLKQGGTPLDKFLAEEAAADLSGASLVMYQELKENVHSVFVLGKRNERYSWLTNLLNRKTYRVRGSEEVAMLDRGSLFNTRLFPHDNVYYFSNYLVLHPGEILRELRRATAKIRRKRELHKTFLFKLLLFQSRWEQYRQMDVAKIYQL